MVTSDEALLRGLLSERKPAEAIVDKAVQLIREMADRPQAIGTIGKQLSSIILPEISILAVLADIIQCVRDKSFVSPQWLYLQGTSKWL